MTELEFKKFISILDDDTDIEYAREAWQSMTKEEQAKCTEESMKKYIKDTYLAVEETKYRDVPKDKYMIAVFRDEKYYEEHNGYPEDFDGDFLCEKYVFDTPEEFVKKWYKLDEGDWYWCFDKGELFCSGAIDPCDIEMFEEHFDINIVYDDENGEGYSIFVAAKNKDEALLKAKNEKLFVAEYDFEDIDYIEEIDKEEYDRATA